MKKKEATYSYLNFSCFSAKERRISHFSQHFHGLPPFSAYGLTKRKVLVKGPSVNLHLRIQPAKEDARSGQLYYNIREAEPPSSDISNSETTLLSFLRHRKQNYLTEGDRQEGKRKTVIQRPNKALLEQHLNGPIVTQYIRSHELEFISMKYGHINNKRKRPNQQD